MSYTLPVTAVPALGGALWPVTFLLLQVITNIYYHFAGLNRLLGARWLARPARDPAAARSAPAAPPTAAAFGHVNSLREK